MSSASEDTKPFLGHETDGAGDDLPSTDRLMLQQSRPASSQWRRSLWVVHVIFLGLNFAFLLYNIGDVGKRIGPEAFVLERAYSPARAAIQYIVKEEMPMLPDSVLTGPPGPEADKAWEELEKPFMLRFSADEMDQMGKTSLALKDGSGYIGYLESFHMLHCVGIMCNVDTSIGTYHWKEGGTIKGKEMMDIEANRTGHRQCTDFSKVQSWAKDRILDFDVHDTDKFLRTLEPQK
ncbi:hypothetical protein HJFPF1_04803 [Paramyrothecium foliicola]|nr:hypothetical protein HJFPF1_04803 [Paramyrothecium foliicola]